MNVYLLLPLVSCIACSVLMTAVLARDSRRTASRIAALVAACGAYWSACEVLWNTVDDPTIAMRLISLSAFGWMFIGPAVLHLFTELVGHPVRRRPWFLAALYVPPAVLALLGFTTSLIHVELIRTSWGWGYQVGPLFPVALAMSGVTVSAGMLIGARHLHSLGSPAERRQIGILYGGLGFSLVVATLTDGFLPLFGYQPPRLGAASITLLVGTTAWAFRRFGYSLLAPGAFANEILMSLREGIALVRLDGRVHSANVGMGRLLATSPASLEGRELRELLDLDLPHPIPELNEVECCLTLDSRAKVPVSLCTSRLDDKQGNAIGVVVVARDLREIESLRSRLITSGRLAAVGELAAGIAHEINNPVTFVRANLGVLEDILSGTATKLAEGDEAALAEIAEGRELIEESLEGVDRVASIVRDVKGFAHSGGESSEAIEIRPLLEAVMRVAAPQTRFITVDTDFGDVPMLRGAPQELKQVFLNLLINASQAVKGDERVEIATRAEGDRVIVEVRDEGCGMDDQVKERIFDPFFTTKPVGEGTGLGLSISYQIVASHGGVLSVQSRPGEGTVFRVELPVWSES